MFYFLVNDDNQNSVPVGLINGVVKIGNNDAPLKKDFPYMSDYLEAVDELVLELKDKKNEKKLNFDFREHQGFIISHAFWEVISDYKLAKHYPVKPLKVKLKDEYLNKTDLLYLCFNFGERKTHDGRDIFKREDILDKNKSKGFLAVNGRSYIPEVIVFNSEYQGYDAFMFGDLPVGGFKMVVSEALKNKLQSEGFRGFKFINVDSWRELFPFYNESEHLPKKIRRLP